MVEQHDLKFKLQLRAKLLADIRSFFYERHVTEVETPLLAPSTIPSPHIQSFITHYNRYAFRNSALSPPSLITSPDSPTSSSSIASSSSSTFLCYLQTSPEFAMKRLLAQHSGDIYQICKAFRNGGESGAQHNPEFTILEWYRVGYDHHQLMDEMDALLQYVLYTKAATRFTYAEIFVRYLNINPHLATLAMLQQCVQQQNMDVSSACAEENDKDLWLQLLFTHCIEPQLAQSVVPIFIYDFPASQAALARLRKASVLNSALDIAAVGDNNCGAGDIHDDHVCDYDVAERFEVYFRGIELANGFHELNDAVEQRRRFEQELVWRRQHGFECPSLDEKFLQALSHMPACAGVAVGVDRLLMLLANACHITDVMSFTIDTI